MEKLNYEFKCVLIDLFAKTLQLPKVEKLLAAFALKNDFAVYESYKPKLERKTLEKMFLDFVNKQIKDLHEELRRIVKTRSRIFSIALSKVINFRLREDWSYSSKEQEFLLEFEDMYISVFQKKTGITGGPRFHGFLLEYMKNKLNKSNASERRL